MIVKERRFVCSDIRKNQNKYWNITIQKDGSSFELYSEYGRVGDTGQSTSYGHFPSLEEAERELEKKVKSKLKPSKTREPYREIEFVDAPQISVKNVEVEKAIETTESELISYLSQVNIHNITSSTSIEIDSDGLFKTPLGIVGLNTVAKARDTLQKIARAWKDYDEKRIETPNFDRLVEDYIMLIPQNIGRKKLKVSTLFPSYDAVLKQNDILDALESSIQKVEQEKVQVKGGSDDISTTAKLFPVTDQKEFAGIVDSFILTRGRYSTYKPIKIWKVEIQSMNAGWRDFGEKLGNIVKLWHGTSNAHLLSILYRGFMIPPASASFINGSAYGRGIYGADRSEKSLGYIRGDRKFMFQIEFAMGKTYETGWNSGKSFPIIGYDSTFAKSDGTLRMNEYIVYNTGQCRPLYLLEVGQ